MMYLDDLVINMMVVEISDRKGYIFCEEVTFNLNLRLLYTAGNKEQHSMSDVYLSETVSQSWAINMFEDVTLSVYMSFCSVGLSLDP